MNTQNQYDYTAMRDCKRVFHLSAYDEHEYRNKSQDDFTNEWSPGFLLVVSGIVLFAGGVWLGFSWGGI